MQRNAASGYFCEAVNNEKGTAMEAVPAIFKLLFVD